jgi:hypothetical protein
MIIVLIQNILKHFLIKNEKQICKYSQKKNNIFNKFIYSRNPFPPLSNIDTLRKDKYDANLIKSINSATLIKSLGECKTLNSNMFYLIENQNTYEIIFI